MCTIFYGFYEYLKILNLDLSYLENGRVKFNHLEKYENLDLKELELKAFLFKFIDPNIK